jgi:signal transduction histidine kinase
MHTAVTVVRYANLALYVALGIASWRAWHRRRSTAAGWSAATFGLFGGTVALLTFVPGSTDQPLWEWLVKVGLAGLVLFPYFLYRFMAAFDPPGRGLERFAFLFTAALVVWTLALPNIPREGEPRGVTFEAFVLAFLIHWTTFSSIAAYRLWRAGRGQPSVARLRMRLLALGSIGLTLALLISGPGVGGEGLRLAIQLLSFASALLFFLALVTPAFLRTLWRRPEQERLREAVAGLMGAGTRAEIADALLPHVTALVGARGSALVGRGGETIGTHGVAGAATPPSRIELPSGELVVWTSPLTPFFGREEIDLLGSLGVLLALALERAGTLEREREATQRLRELNELKDTFLSAVSHELRTPLTAILGFSLTLEERWPDLRRDQVRELTSQLVVAARRLERMLSDLLDLDRLSRGVLEPRLEQVDVAAVVERTLADMELEGSEPVVETQTAVAPVDVAKLERIVENLVYNAHRHTPDGTRVWVHVSSVVGGVEVVVADDGPGVPQELRRRIFEPFERGSSSDPTTGTGIGLSLVARFAALHGGRVWVDDRPGGGAAFHVLLPQETAREPVTVY